MRATIWSCPIINSAVPVKKRHRPGIRGFQGKSRRRAVRFPCRPASARFLHPSSRGLQESAEFENRHDRPLPGIFRRMLELACERLRVSHSSGICAGNASFLRGFKLDGPLVSNCISNCVYGIGLCKDFDAICEAHTIVCNEQITTKDCTRQKTYAIRH